MFIRDTHDGRTYEGAAVEVVEEMRGESFFSTASLGEYVDGLTASIRRFRGVDLKVEGATGEEKAERLVDAMLEAGLFEHVE